MSDLPEEPTCLRCGNEILNVSRLNPSPEEADLCYRCIRESREVLSIEEDDAVIDDLEPECTNCGRSMAGVSALKPTPEEMGLCPSCIIESRFVAPTEEEEQKRLEDRQAKLRSGYRSDLEGFLDHARVPRGRTREASREGVPEFLWKLVPERVLTAMRAGSISSLNGVGFGIVGGTGVGKTALMSVLLKGYFGRAFTRWVETEPFRASPDLANETVCWVSWPDIADELSRLATSYPTVEAMVALPKRATLLVLDDIGRERQSKRSDEMATPFHLAQLDRLISYRNEMRRPIFWTSNVGLPELRSLYGSALLSRLLQDNPPIMLPEKRPNLRLR